MESSTNFPNITLPLLYDNISNVDCSQQQQLSLQEFSQCYRLFFRERPVEVLAGISVAVLSFVFNALLIVALKQSQTKKMCIFNTILIGHGIVNGLTGLVDIPIFHVRTVFGYWPLSTWISILWSIYDNNINFTTNMHMVYMAYARIRSINKPTTYKTELLMRHPIRVMISFWVFGIGIWVSNWR